MTKAGKRMIEGAKEAVAVARGEQPAASITVAGHTYVPKDRWQPVERAPKDRTVIWAALRSDIFPGLCPGREDLGRWNSLQVPLRHPGVAADGFDVGWDMAAPVGHGGIPDEWIAGWMSLPTPPSVSPNGK